MADDVADLPSPDSGGGKGGGNPLIPVIAVAVIIPLVTVALMEFYIAPKIKTIVHEAALGQDASHGGGDRGGDDYGGGGDHGGGDHGEGDGHGGGGAHGGMHHYEFSNIVANLMGSLKSRYLKVSFTVESEDPNLEALMTANKAKILDVTLGVLSSLTLQDLEEPGIKNVIRNDLLAGFATVLKTDAVKYLYFSEFVVQ